MRSARAVLPFVLFFSFFFIAISAQGAGAADQVLRPRPWMGITVRDAVRPVPGVPGANSRGVVVADVIKGGPAEAAGIRESDVITGINGREIYGVADFVTELQHLGIGEPVVVEVDSSGAVKTVDVVLARRPAGLFARKGPYAASMGYTGDMPFACGGDGHTGMRADGCDGHGAVEGHTGHTGDIWMSGDSKYGKMYLMGTVRMLGLDPEQQKKADGLETGYRKQTIKLGSQIDMAEVELEELASSDKVDLKKVRAKIDEIAGRRAELRFMRYRSLEEFRQLLTPEQRARLDKFAIIEAAGHGEYGPGYMGVEVYGTGGCDMPGHGGPRVIEVPAQ